MEMKRLERCRAIFHELAKRMALNHSDIIITMKKTGREYNIFQLRNNKIMVYTDRAMNENEETIWKTQVGVFKDIWEVSKFIEQLTN